MSRAVIFGFVIHGLVVVLLLVNAAPSPFQGAGLFATTLTLSLVNTMWAFVRRISSLLGDKPGEDWARNAADLSILLRQRSAHFLALTPSLEFVQMIKD